MGLKIIKMDKQKLLGDEVLSCVWEYGPVKDEKEGWAAVAKAVKGISSLADVKSVRVLGPDHADKELSDIGEKYFKSVDDMAKELDKMAEDGNYSAEVNVMVGDNYVRVDVQILTVKEVVEFIFADEEKAVKLISTAIKKALG